MVKNKCGCRQSSCSTCCPKQKKPGPNIPPCVCPRAFDDAFIDSLFAAYAFNAATDDPVAQAELLQSFFSPTGCQQFNFDPPVCGAALLADNTAINSFIQSVGGSLSFQILSIGPRRVENCTTIVTVTLVTTFTAPGIGTQKIFGFAEIVVNPDCSIQLVNFFNVIEEFMPAAAPAVARTAASALPAAVVKRFPGLAKR